MKNKQKMTSAKGMPSPYKMACKEDHFFDGNYVYQVKFQTCCTNNSSNFGNNQQPLLIIFSLNSSIQAS